MWYTFIYLNSTAASAADDQETATTTRRMVARVGRSWRRFFEPPILRAAAYRSGADCAPHVLSAARARRCGCDGYFMSRLGFNIYLAVLYFLFRFFHHHILHIIIYGIFFSIQRAFYLCYLYSFWPTYIRVQEIRYEFCPLETTCVFT